MGDKEEQMRLWLEDGWRCLNCGEHVPDSCFIVFDEKKDISKFMCQGICRSDTCRELPPGGNPFYVVIE